MISRGIWRRLNGILILAGYGFALRLFAQSYTELLQKPILTEAEGIVSNALDGSKGRA